MAAPSLYQLYMDSPDVEIKEPRELVNVNLYSPGETLLQVAFVKPLLLN